MKRVAVILSGCGVFDGAEIHESVLTLLALDRANARAVCAAPDVLQHHVVNHLTKQPAQGETRNVLIESARIARGNIVPLNQLKLAEVDAVILPGGFGAAKNLCTFAVEGPNCSVQPDVARVIKEAHAARKVLAFVCIAPVIAAKVLGKQVGPKLTIGDDRETAEAINAMGAQHVVCPVREALVDKEQRVISTPAYMKANSVAEVYAGVTNTVAEMLKMIG
jgi:enhancing lycopene biosynthesis protein 2